MCSTTGRRASLRSGGAEEASRRSRRHHARGRRTFGALGALRRGARDLPARARARAHRPHASEPRCGSRGRRPQPIWDDAVEAYTEARESLVAEATIEWTLPADARASAAVRHRDTAAALDTKLDVAAIGAVEHGLKRTAPGGALRRAAGRGCAARILSGGRGVAGVRAARVGGRIRVARRRRRRRPRRRPRKSTALAVGTINRRRTRGARARGGGRRGSTCTRSPGTARRSSRRRVSRIHSINRPVRRPLDRRVASPSLWPTRGATSRRPRARRTRWSNRSAEAARCTFYAAAKPMLPASRESSPSQNFSTSPGTGVLAARGGVGERVAARRGGARPRRRAHAAAGALVCRALGMRDRPGERGLAGRGDRPRTARPSSSQGASPSSGARESSTTRRRVSRLAESTRRCARQAPTLRTSLRRWRRRNGRFWGRWPTGLPFASSRRDGVRGAVETRAGRALLVDAHGVPSLATTVSGARSTRQPSTSAAPPSMSARVGAGAPGRPTATTISQSPRGGSNTSATAPVNRTAPVGATSIAPRHGRAPSARTTNARASTAPATLTAGRTRTSISLADCTARPTTGALGARIASERLGSRNRSRSPEGPPPDAGGCPTLRRPQRRGRRQGPKPPAASA